MESVCGVPGPGVIPIIHKVRLLVRISAKLSIGRMYWYDDALVVFLS